MQPKTEEELRFKAAAYLETKARESTCFSPTSEQRLPRFTPTGKIYISVGRNREHCQASSHLMSLIGLNITSLIYCRNTTRNSHWWRRILCRNRNIRHSTRPKHRRKDLWRTWDPDGGWEDCPGSYIYLFPYNPWRMQTVRDQKTVIHTHPKFQWNIC